LSSRLAVLDFRGLVRIESHVGDFCMSLAEPGDFALAAPTLLATQCDQIGFAPGDTYEMSLRQSVSFANFVNLANERTGGRIRYEIVPLGNSNPLLPYPAATDGISAKEWNEIAASNHRVDVSLYPDLPEGGLAR
jgi:hypothetical protein